MTRPAHAAVRLCRIPTSRMSCKAAHRIAGAAHRTPVLTSRTADAATGATLYFKAENLQRAGAFKFRGAYNAIAALEAGVRKRGVIAYSSGNHAQAIAYAAALQGAPATIVMPSDAPAMKVAATKGYGAEVVFYDRYKEDRDAISRRLAAESGATLIPPYDHPDVIAGQGTAVLELSRRSVNWTLLVTPLGGGGLLGGSALAVKAMSPKCSVVGIEPEAGNDGQQSLAKGEVVRIPIPKSIADGALTPSLGDHNFPIIQSAVERIVTVSDAQLIDALRFFAERMKIVVEPTGCLAAAAVLSGVLDCKGKRVGIVLSGGNVDLKALAGFLA